jgi:4-hydroxythreonine-4-phosphate dehydrogenase
MSNKNHPILGISMGDPAGIGPEVTLQTLARPDIYRICRPLVIGDLGVLQKAREILGLDLELLAVDDPGQGSYAPGQVDIFDMHNLRPEDHVFKQVTAAQGKAAFEYVVKNIELAMEGLTHGTVTGPINKAAINAAGHHFAGHTEIYATYTKTRDYAMMLVEQNFRVSHVSTHVSLREACDRVKRERVLRVIQLTHDALIRMGIDNPRIAAAGLNPHCGEEGLFGHEDEQEVLPAVQDAMQQGIIAEGPIPADTVFSKMQGGMYDAVVVMYHDQGHIPTKLIGFRYDQATGKWGNVAGVNVTLGLPIIRTSVDHGTAFEIAGEAKANPESLIDSIELAARLAKA